MKTKWTSHQLSILRRRWESGVSASCIGKELMVTKNSVIGMVRRNGWKTPNAKPVNRKTTATETVDKPSVKAKSRVPVARPRNHISSKASRDIAVARARVNVRKIVGDVFAESKAGVKISDLKIDSCRWPLGDPKSPSFRYCGEPAATWPYCDHHRSIAYCARIVWDGNYAKL